MLRLVASLTTAFGFGLGLAWLVPAAPEPLPLYQIEVITADGNAYVAGSGDDCATAWQGAVMPDDWREIACRSAR